MLFLLNFSLLSDGLNCGVFKNEIKIYICGINRVRTRKI